MKNVKFPILDIGDDKFSFGVFTKIEQITTCNYLSFKKGNRINSRFIDSDGDLSGFIGSN